MSQVNKQLTRRWFDEVWNKRNRAAIDELLDADAIVHGLSGTVEPVRGREGFKQFHEAFLAAFPDIRVTPTHCFTEEDFATVRFTFEATHSGPGFGEPTNRHIKCSGIAIVRWRDGKMIEGWNEFDRHGLMQQIAAR